MNKKKLNKIANSFHNDLNSNLKNPKFKKDFYNNLLKYQIANEIINFRKKQGVTQSELAKKINTTQAVVSRIENGQVCASTNILQRICSKYGIEAKFELSDAI
ncbi:helix-turn-helix transcriptional regulator [Candidatus Parcubacteria bacterium]|nr:helix-turn-helix transcriptional regulator [Candidatus Parcubacteria bacterium]